MNVQLKFECYNLISNGHFASFIRRTLQVWSNPGLTTNMQDEPMEWIDYGSMQVSNCSNVPPSNAPEDMDIDP